MSVPKSLDWKSVKAGYALYVVDNGKYVWWIDSTGLVDGTDYLWEAKAWKTINGATKAASRISKEHGTVMVCRFHYDEEGEKRIIDDRFHWAA